MTRQPFSVAPAGPRKGFWKEDECMFSDGSPLAMLNPSSFHWQGASHRPNSASSLGLGLGPPLTLHGPWVSLCHTNPGHTRYPEFLDLIHLTQHNAGQEQGLMSVCRTRNECAHPPGLYLYALP